MALKDIYRNTAVGSNCKRILSQFDLIVANSGGSLVLAAMICFDDISEVENLFKNKLIREKIFSPAKGKWYTPFFRIKPLKALMPKYSTQQKLIGIQETLGRIGDFFLDELPQ